jgi:hypothetical protein
MIRIKNQVNLQHEKRDVFNDSRVQDEFYSGPGQVNKVGETGTLHLTRTVRKLPNTVLLD